MYKRMHRTVPAFLFLILLFATSTTALAAAPVDFRELVKGATPAVVNISTERTEETRGMTMPFEFFGGHPDMERFFGPSPFDDFYNRAPRSRKTSSLGSGFIISPDGYIVTNNHVVQDADVIRVNMGSKKGEKPLEAVIVGTDPETDLALIKVEASGLPYLKFGDSDELEVGEWVVAIGSPLGLDHTVTAGIVSGKGRNIQSGSYDDYLQTDASINRGNSGGPLLNMKGEVIGINTAIAQRAQGIGFAIPSSMARPIIDNLREFKKANRGWLGVTIQNVDEAMAMALELKEPTGALVNSVLDGQPAAEAGVKAGDVILSLDGDTVKNTEQLLRKVASLSPGSTVKAILWRDGKELTVTIKVAERDLTQADASSGGSASSALLGVEVRPVNPDDVRRHNLRGVNGLLVTSVKEGSVAGMAGIQPGDVILAANKSPVNSAAELSAQINAGQKNRGAVLLHVARKGRVFFIALATPKN
ncbi:Do family serine endopeptidase [Desulfovibrio sp. OttesenSCG-928-A18]|nr:Do family serine endopeptidase [Desulfovibrio sp. OttesenSCG-928-A18]